MNVDGALAELLQLSSQVQAAAVLSVEGSLLGSAPPHSRRAKALGAAVPGLLERAGAIRREDISVDRVEVRLPDGGVFVVRAGDLVAAAVTARDPIASLVVYDLKKCLHRLAADPGGRDA